MKVDFINSHYRRTWARHKEEFFEAIDKMGSEGQWLLGEEMKRFEENFAKFVGTKYCVALNSGHHAIYLALKALGVKEGDEVITSSHTFKATLAAVLDTGAKVIMVDIKDDGLIDPDEVEKAITLRTKAIIPVHLAGQMCDLEKLEKIAEKYDIMIVEDSAQMIKSK